MEETGRNVLTSIEHPNVGAPAKPGRLAFCALFIKQRLGLIDEETVEQIREKTYTQFFVGFFRYSNEPPFGPSMMVLFSQALLR
jgi:hypothetical protein